MSKINQNASLPPAEVDPVDLPENAFRELGADEEYRPVMHPAHDYPEVTPYSVTMGLVLAVVFSAAAAYLGLKVGQVFEAAIPIAIIAVGLSSARKMPNALWSKCDNTIDWRMFGRDCSRCHLYASCSLYPASHLSRDFR